MSLVYLQALQCIAAAAHADAVRSLKQVAAAAAHIELSVQELNPDKVANADETLTADTEQAAPSDDLDDIKQYFDEYHRDKEQQSVDDNAEKKPGDDGSLT